MPNTPYLNLPYPGLNNAPNVAADIQALATPIDSLLGAPYTAWTPTWTTTATAPALGNGTITGRYQRIGRNLDYSIVFTVGSTTTFGSGTWTFTLPSGMTAGPGDQLGVALAEQGATVAVGATKVVAGTNTVTRIYFGTTTVGPTAPFTWASGNKVTVTGRIELA